MSEAKIESAYLQLYQQKLCELGYETDSPKIPKVAEREAQKYAIKETTLYFFAHEPNFNRKEVWASIYSSHVARKAGVNVTPEQVEKVISADNSWKKSSGHAFEEIVKSLSNDALAHTGISVVLQKEALVLLKKNKVLNEERDKKWLLDQIHASIFDLFVVKDNYIFGCIQAKTSIRDRVTRDREPSIKAMSKFFWSIAFALDGAFLSLPKFKAMVNGGSPEFETNGWHSMYVFSVSPKAVGNRIFQLDKDLEIFKQHAIKASSDWHSKRQWFTEAWAP